MGEEKKEKYPAAAEPSVGEPTPVGTHQAALQDQVLRARAELENLRKRSVREVEDAHKYALQRFVRELLPVRDSLEKALEVSAEGDTGEEEGLKQGIVLTLRLWDDVWAREGVVAVDPLGEPFDPDFHEALSLRSAPGVPPDTVVEVVQKGYLLNGRLVRPARVLVSVA